MSEIIRVLRLYEFTGPRAAVEQQLANSMQGDKVLAQKDVVIRVGQLGTFPEVLDGTTLLEWKRQKAEIIGAPKAWKPIWTAPKDQWVEVRGDSLMISPKYFVCLAKHDAEYRPLDPWIGVQRDCLSEFGWVPAEWRETDEENQV